MGLMKKNARRQQIIKRINKKKWQIFRFQFFDIG